MKAKKITRTKPTKRKTKDYIQITMTDEFILPYVFCVRCNTDKEAHELKSFIDYCLKGQDSKVVYGYYRISPMEDIVYLYHKSDELDLPDDVRFYTPQSVVDEHFVMLKKERIMHRTEEDFKGLYAA